MRFGFFFKGLGDNLYEIWSFSERVTPLGLRTGPTAPH